MTTYDVGGMANAAPVQLGSGKVPSQEGLMLAIRFRRVMVIALVATTAAGCLRKGRTEDAGPLALEAITTTRVSNKQWLDLKVYALRAGGGQSSQVFVGIAKAFTSQVFELPPDVVETHRLQIGLDPIGSRRRYRTEPIHVVPGQHIDLVVPERLDQTYYSVFDRAVATTQ